MGVMSSSISPSSEGPSNSLRLLSSSPILQLALIGLDEDMTPMYMTMFGAWYGGVGGHQGCASQEGGPRLIRFESPRWRPKATQVSIFKKALLQTI